MLSPEAEPHSSRLLGYRGHLRPESPEAAARQQLAGVAGVVVQGGDGALTQFNSVLRRVGDHEGWPRFESSAEGIHLFRCSGDGEWCIHERFDPEGEEEPDAFFATDGLLPVGLQEWSCNAEDICEDSDNNVVYSPPDDGKSVSKELKRFLSEGSASSPLPLILNVTLLSADALRTAAPAASALAQTPERRPNGETELELTGSPRWLALPPVDRIFAMFDADADGHLSKDEYKTYLQAIGEWGAGAYTGDSYDVSGWMDECAQVCADPEVGISWEQFETVLYGRASNGQGKGRGHKAVEDMEKCEDWVRCERASSPRAWFAALRVESPDALSN